MKKSILVLTTLALGLSLSACSKDDDKKKTEEQKSGDVVVTTDTSICQGAQAAGMSIFSNAWLAKGNSENGFGFEYRLQVLANSMNLDVTCVKGDARAVARLSVNAAVTESEIEVLSNDDATAEGQAGNEKINCSAGLKKGTKMQYTFQGPCLKMQMADGTLVMVPAK